MYQKVNRICHISTVHPLYDDRIFYKECISLSKDNYEVFLIISHSINVTIQNVKIVSLPYPSNRIRRFFCNSFTALHKAYSLKPALVHIHDPELMLLGIFFRLLGRKVIYDVHEDIAKQTLYKRWIGVHFFRFVTAKVLRFTEFLASLFFSAIVVVTEDIQRNFRYSKTVLIRNYPRLDLIQDAQVPGMTKNRKVVIYTGNLSEVRGIKQIIDAMAFVDAELWLIGRWESDDYNALCMKSDGWKNSKYIGEKRLEEVYGYLKLADIGLALLLPIKNYLTSLPVKAYEYMALGIPMILSDFEYWKEVFSGCALFADPYNTDDIVDKINILLTDVNVCQELSRNAQLRIGNGCTWETESKKLLSLYKGLLNEN